MITGSNQQPVPVTPAPPQALPKRVELRFTEIFHRNIFSTNKQTNGFVEKLTDVENLTAERGK